jgi:hypothetical protein
VRTLPPYNPTNKCPKCGFNKVNTVYQRPQRYREPWECCTRGSHLDRRCQRCGYTWCEAALPRVPKVTRW